MHEGSFVFARLTSYLDRNKFNYLVRKCADFLLNQVSDAVGYMAGQLTMEKYPDKIRRVIYLDNESKKKFIFFTNALTINPVMVAELYHNRWQIELSFKWIKQHLKIKKF